MEGLENTIVTAIDRLATLYARPSERVLRKEIDHVDAVGRAFIAASPFLVLATGNSDGLDCSPKGDKPGFVQVEDDGRTLLIPDRRGNNRIDSIKNVVADPRVALIFLVPGANETYRVNGRDQVSVDPVLKRRFAVDGKEPTTVILVAVEQAFQHCPKALVRNGEIRSINGEMRSPQRDRVFGRGSFCSADLNLTMPQRGPTAASDRRELLSDKCSWVVGFSGNDLNRPIPHDNLHPG
jgi:PPOX class probable FMN-dependent enzyme